MNPSAFFLNLTTLSVITLTALLITAGYHSLIS